MNYISISIPVYILFMFLLSIHHTHFNPPDWDLQGDHSLLQADNLRGIDPYSRKVYYLDDPVHLLVSCAKLWQSVIHVWEHQVFGAIVDDQKFVHQVFGAIAGDCSSLENWRFILLLRLGTF